MFKMVIKQAQRALCIAPTSENTYIDVIGGLSRLKRKEKKKEAAAQGKDWLAFVVYPFRS